MFTFSLKVPCEDEKAFCEWQAKLNALIAGSPGFVSLESSLSKGNWRIVERFKNEEALTIWKNSKEYQLLQNELALFTDIQESGGTSNEEATITEVFVTQISPGKEREFREWSAKIHKIEAQFPGFRGTYFQSPHSHHGKNWITMIQFDTQEHLDNWLTSREREEVLKEAKPFITSLEDHRVISPYAGWFSSIAKEDRGDPPPWKQGMLVLLVLYPIVMLEFIFLTPWIRSLNIATQTFIGNVISVSLVTFPLMPIAIHYFAWWLLPNKKMAHSLSRKGLVIIFALYLLEIIIFFFYYKLTS